MFGIRREVSASAQAGCHALRGGAHRRPRRRSLSTVSSVLVVVIAAGAIAVSSNRSAVADDIVSAPVTPTPGVPVLTTQREIHPVDLPKAVVKPPVKVVITSKAAAHAESMVRASRAGRRGTKVYNLVYAATYVKFAMGWSSKEVGCLNTLWAGESNWRPMARNRRSGAYGIPQALPGHKMAVEGRDWKSNPDTQIRWGAKYIKVKYTTPCRALKFKRHHHWY